jgi:hypothetical protein
MNPREEIEEKLKSVRDHVKELSGLFELIIDDLDKVFSRVFDINWELMDVTPEKPKPNPKPKTKKPKAKAKAKAKAKEILDEVLDIDTEETIQHL